MIKNQYYFPNYYFSDRHYIEAQNPFTGLDSNDAITLGRDKGAVGIWHEGWTEAGNIYNHYLGKENSQRSQLANILIVIQAGLLSLLIAVMPIILVFGAFRVGTVANYYIIIFCILTMFPITWSFLDWLERVMYSSSTSWYNYILNRADVGTGFTYMYIISTLAIMGIFSITGWKVGAIVNSVGLGTIAGNGSLGGGNPPSLGNNDSSSSSGASSGATKSATADEVATAVVL